MDSLELLGAPTTERGTCTGSYSTWTSTQIMTQDQIQYIRYLLATLRDGI
jgi:hypothetical protein